MRNALTYTLLLLVLFFSCTKETENPVRPSRLVQLDSLLQADSLKKGVKRGYRTQTVNVTDNAINSRTPSEQGGADRFPFREKGTPVDSVLACLEHYPIEELQHAEDSAYHLLLLTEARVKRHRLIEMETPERLAALYQSDSLLQQVAAHYDRQGEALLKARAHYLLGYVSQLGGNRKAAIREYLTALPHARTAACGELLMHIYNKVGHEYYQRMLYQRADSIYRLAEEQAIAQGDSSVLAEVLYYDFEAQRCNSSSSLFYDFDRRQALLLRILNVARAARHREIEGLTAIRLGEICLFKGENNQALAYGKQAQRLLSNAYGELLLGDAYAAMELYDSAAVHFTRVYGPDWQRKGVKWGRTLRNTSARNEGVVTAEKELQLQEQQATFEGFLKRYKTLIAGILLASVLCIVLLRFFYRRRYRRQSERLLQQQRENQVLYALLRKELRLKEEEMLCLQQQIAEHQHDEELPHLSQLLTQAADERDILLKQSLEHSPAYKKIHLIMADFRWKEESHHELSDEEWQELLQLLNATHNNLFARLQHRHGLSLRELQVCCLLLLDIPVTHIAHILHYTRQSVYRDEAAILQKLNEPYEKGKLKTWLRT